MKKLAKKPIDIFKAAKTTGDLIKSFRVNFNIKQDDMAQAFKRRYDHRAKKNWTH